MDIVLGRRWRYTRENGKTFQRELLIFLAWMSRWEADHDERVNDGKQTEYHFFADSTWQCIQMMVLGHFVVIEVWCIQRRMEVNPRVMNTDPVEHHFGNLRQMIGGSHSGLNCMSASQGGAKGGLAKQANYAPVGNNKCAEEWGSNKVKH